MRATARRKLVWATNIWSPHMVPLARELAEELGPGRFAMLVFEAVHEERLRLGWPELSDRPEWLLGPPGNAVESASLAEEIYAAEVAVVGSVPEAIQVKRANTGRLTFLLAERMLKKPWHQIRMLNPRYAGGIRRSRALSRRPNVHALAIGGHAPSDLHEIGACESRIWTWAYFVDLNPMPPAAPRDTPLEVLWAGRMLRWKRVDLLLRAVAAVGLERWFGRCTIVGDGPERDHLMALASKLSLSEGKVRFMDPLPIEDVRKLMRDCDAYVLCSNRFEGWGAVAGEAMSEGSILIGNEAAGAPSAVVRHGENGFLFRDGDGAEIAHILRMVGTDVRLRGKIQQQAWKDIWGLWSPKVGAYRLVRLIDDLLVGGGGPGYICGPCSRPVPLSGKSQGSCP